LCLWLDNNIMDSIFDIIKNKQKETAQKYELSDEYLDSLSDKFGAVVAIPARSRNT